MILRRCCAVAALLLTASVAHAQVAPPEQTALARARFEAGLTRAQRGDLGGALDEFEAAYAIRPHFSVLYNIGQARSTLGHPVEAVAAFEKYLADGGSKVSAARREEVEALLASVRARIGQLSIVVPPQGSTRVWLDGRELTNDELKAPLLLAVGDHSVLASSGIGAAQSHVVSITNAKPTELRIKAPAPLPAPKAMAQLIITCDVPDIDVDIPGAASARTPLQAPLLVPEGSLNVRFSRPGYEPTSKSLVVKPHEITTIPCDQRATSPLPRQLQAQLAVLATPSDAVVTIDGEHWAKTPLPSGAHRLLVERDGFVPFTKTISLIAGKTTTFEATLVPTAAMREREQRAATKQKTIGLVVAGIGLALVGTGAAVYSWNSGRYETWSAQRASTDATSNTKLATSVQRADDGAFALMGLGAAGLIGGSWLFFDAF
jgi:hypothetical protein